MAADRLALPPVRLLPEDELARLALAVPLLERAVRLARWAGPETRVDVMGELTQDDRLRAAAELGIEAYEDGLAETSQAWGIAIDTGLVELEIDEAAGEATEPGEPAGKALPGEALAQLTAGEPQDVLEVWLATAETALAEAASPDFEGLRAAIGGDDQDGEDGVLDLDALDWDPEEESEFLDAALANLYAYSAMEEDGHESVPLPVLAASLVVPEDMDDPTDAILEEVTEVMMRLDDHFRLLAPTGLIEYQPVDDALIEETDEEEAEALSGELDPEEISRYGMVRLTPLGVFGVRARLLDAGAHAPATGDLTDRTADVLLDALTDYPDQAARAEAELWLSGREPGAAARELLAASTGDDLGAPGRRLMCQQTLSLLGPEAEPALRDVLDDRQIGGLARVWLTERGAGDVPAPDEAMVFWLTVDTLAAQLDADSGPELLGELVRDLVAQHDGFFEAVWRVDHPATSDVLEAMGRLHPDKAIAKTARKAAFKARSKAGSEG
ncbi:hypothetical protein QMK19_19740 [Streptomyces sp. H10-C2]|uniref:hypothetical protein n=1 Tax=unclassified Streptomyces TaxID=2593676 RepID=UPI0024BA4682|nr:MULTISPECIES: hypothetical protein [unclassified Streptomyces]MDJ0345481.1 hypothetical protein [Streptomyces sp. PH10-H1]MDJ0371847.1 hypothetical protein [Streptomyces sp. H10-C2]